MPDRVRVYHPETGEAFDLPVAKAAELRLNEGWLAQPLDTTATPAVQNVITERGTVTHHSEEPEDDAEDWRLDSDDEETD